MPPRLLPIFSIDIHELQGLRPHGKYDSSTIVDLPFFSVLVHVARALVAISYDHELIRLVRRERFRINSMLLCEIGRMVERIVGGTRFGAWRVDST